MIDAIACNLHQLYARITFVLKEKSSLTESMSPNCLLTVIELNDGDQVTRQLHRSKAACQEADGSTN